MEDFGQNVEVIVHAALMGSDVWHATLTHSPTGRSGFGTGYSQKEAVTKGLAELVERSAFQRFAESIAVHTSNRFATHVDSHLARSAAISELIERDILLTMWLGRRPPLWQVTHAFPTYAIEIALGIAGVSCGCTCVIGVLKPMTGSQLSFGGVVATSVAQTVEDARAHTLLDLRRAATLILQRHHDGTPIFRPVAVQDVRAGADHLEFYLDPRNFAELDWFVRGAGDALELSPIPVDAVEIPRGEFGIENLVTYRATSSFAQQFFFGATRHDLINYDRVQQALGSATVNLQLHPLA